MNPLKHLLTTILLLTATLLPAQTYDLNYSRSVFPLLWKFTKIEVSRNTTYIYLTVCNEAAGSYTLYDIGKEQAYFWDEQGYHQVKSSKNSLSRSSKNSEYTLNCGQKAYVVLEFPNTQIIGCHSLDLKIFKSTLKDIPLFEKSFLQLNQQMQTWEEFYAAHRKQQPTYATEAELKKAIENEVKIWQAKGEFEPTATWKARVNDRTLEEFTRVATKKHLDKYQSEQQLIKQEQLNIAQEYNRYKEDILNQFYKRKTAKAKKQFSAASFTLNPYDADNETFMIHSNAYGDILLPVPLADAPSFKQNWQTIKGPITPEFVPNGEDVALTKLVFTNNGKEFVYDSHTEAKYAITDVKYNFAPIEIAEIDMANLKIDGLTDIPQEVASTVVGKTSADVLTAKTAQVDRKTVSATDRSDVDTAIPVNSKLKNPTTFAVIIANEKYSNVSPVPFAENDGKVFAKYLNQSLGLPQEHIKTYYNATYGNIAAALKHIENLSTAYGDKLNLILYYAGHGVPNERTKGCMLLPTDGDAQIPETCFQVDKLYETLEKLNANSTIVLMDACFSGSVRGDGMLYASRGIKIKSNLDAPKGNMVIISASQGDETAYPLEKERHGLFTFNLLKYLQEKKGNVNLSDLSNYIVEQVKRQSVVFNGKLQTPMVQYSPAIESEWRSWPLVQ